VGGYVSYQTHCACAWLCVQVCVYVCVRACTCSVCVVNGCCTLQAPLSARTYVCEDIYWFVANGHMLVCSQWTALVLRGYCTLHTCLSVCVCLCV